MESLLGVNVLNQLSYDNLWHGEGDDSCFESTMQLQRTQQGKTYLRKEKTKTGSENRRNIFIAKPTSISIMADPNELGKVDCFPGTE